jgi:hypothetical protein
VSDKNLGTIDSHRLQGLFHLVANPIELNFGQDALLLVLLLPGPRQALDHGMLWMSGRWSIAACWGAICISVCHNGVSDWVTIYTPTMWHT